ncbi:glycogen/starch/alpha-glucan phosphorylase [Desulfococcus multivorans]|jgi:starch phosphorylase|uniref:Alpha-1,4 glucan phosphorylase n=1 Tax=Desulfococcus multivorans DSM 2059 TaxID=1121405 RepID=S7U0N1_DESML|nr:glycogen/starch/alpha-glucan phosphorylase [Desulfococcus multivorans]AOY58375.1 GlgP1: glycogen phosphorylase [Desulfococcus multivorans]AQV00707.1 glycogen phosphorylase [Desulfococcus multivorans]EPR42550.1 glycogen/starch/alpha-glucan phosphorylase [Desulfococcus multivorans DSM 2059]MDX9818316.1 glycogen/starch/alpha-glucan phosphorylase [Desulfococcus multivorans]SKA18872.1 starch phosphorylase [Desulfococcus multivorans DSM 2059]
MKLEAKEDFPPATENDARSGNSVAAIRKSILDHIHFSQARLPVMATCNDWYVALAYTVRDRMFGHWMNVVQAIADPQRKIVGYLSAEFLMGPHLGNALINLGIHDNTRAAVAQLGLNLDDLLAQEEEPGLGNGGLGRLAACYMDSLATLGVPALGYGIRYEFGIFSQEIRDGRQVEKTDKWLRLGNPWEIHRPELSCTVNFGGRTEWFHDERGRLRIRWIPNRVIKGVPYDTPIPAFRKDFIGILRLWKSEAVESFDFQAFNVGDYYKAVDEKVVSETVSKVLYPNDEPEIGKTLRLAQQYFFVSCALQDMIRVHLIRGKALDTFHESFAVQLNDTHPAIAVAELMRLLVDEHDMDWCEAWTITRNVFSYTNHTLLSEALEKWPLPFFGHLLPRHLEIIYEINHRFLEEVRRHAPGDDGLASRLSIIDEGGQKSIRMAHLASVAGHRINGVAELHTKLLSRTVLRDFHAIYPDRFVNVTNGVTPRRWMVLSNPKLAGLLESAIGDRWICRFEEEIEKIAPLADDPAFRNHWREVKRGNKADLAGLIHERTGNTVDPDTLFDVQVKRIHEYKRQHLNVLHIVTLYNRIRRNPNLDITPRTFIFGGKAAPGYAMAKLIIKLINDVGAVVNRDPDVAGRLKVVFFPNFNVKNGQMIYPAAELSEQISTAGKEASGTGNMKFSMNGALTIGTLDGANVEIREAVGPENFFLFGLTVDQVNDLWGRGYNPRRYYEENAQLREAVDLLYSGHFSPDHQARFVPLLDTLLNHDPYMLLADYQAYIDCQDQIAAAYRDQEHWTRISILNVARMGRFSSDRSIREYCKDIWRIRQGV